MARKKRKNRLALPAGIITVLLAVVGLITVIKAGSGYIADQKNKTIKKAGFEQLLKPVVMFDPDPFDDLTQADKSQLLYAAVWNLLLDKEGIERYPYSQGEHFGIQVPQADIEQSFISLFGKEIDIASLHGTIDMSKYDITYDAPVQSYILPITGVDSIYTPKVYDIEKQGNSFLLTVGYISNKAWADIEGDELTAPEPDKYMNITVRQNGDMQYVASIQAADRTEIASRAPTTAEYYEEEETTVPEETTEEFTEESTEPQYETVTDENGEPVTDENGEAVTQEVTGVTPENDSESTGESETSESSENTEKSAEEITQ